MKRALGAVVAICLATATLATTAAASYPAQGNFGLHDFDVVFTNADGTIATQAGSHPFAMATQLAVNVDGEDFPEGQLRDLVIEQLPGLVGDATDAYPRCSTLDFLRLEEKTATNDCPLDTAVGITGNSVNNPDGRWFSAPVFNLVPPPGVLLRFGFHVAVLNIVIDVKLSPEPPYRPVVISRNTPQLADFYANKTQIWGDPSNPLHDELRGPCGVDNNIVGSLFDDDPFRFVHEGESGKTCPVEQRPRPLLTLPTNCSEPLRSDYEAFSWEGESDSGSAITHDAADNPQPFTGCGALPTFDPSIAAQPTSRAAESPTGLDFSLNLKDEGLISTKPGARAKSTIRKVVVTLPEGMTANPSVAEGLEVCSQQQLDDETLASAPGAGCPEASKIGTIAVQSPLVDEAIEGSLFQAEPYANEFGSLLAFYIVLRNPQLGILVKQAAKVEADPETGQLIATTDEIPQLPFSSFKLHFREGGRSPLVTPPLCGDYEVKAEITPWSGTAPAQSTSTFTIVSGPNEGSCPPAGQPFSPGFEAGTQSNAAGRYSPFSMRLTRRDGDQDLVRFDATLPPGLLAKLAGVSKCPEAQIALAKAKTGKAELASPSCPLDSRIGTVKAGAGVGSQLTYVPGSVFLAGPFGGAPLSAIAIVPAVAGPFDVGTVVYRQALVVNPRSGVVTADGAKSTPLPHILAGIPLRVRDIQVHVDRSGFMLNPTSCAELATRASIWGGGANPFSLLDDSPVTRSARFQAADCAALGFKPRLDLKLKGGTRRGAHPALRTVFRPRAGDANSSRVAVRFPRSAFIDQSHFRTICTRVQFAADNCPPGATYGQVRAFTPLLSEPLEGPAILRSSDNDLPDLVFDLHGLVDFEAVVRIDSIRGGLRATAADLPDVPISRVVIEMQGGEKGLFVNSRNLCAAKNRAKVRFDAHSGKGATLRPVVKARCKKGPGGGRRGR